jgi:hypothetical protein
MNRFIEILLGLIVCNQIRVFVSPGKWVVGVYL